MLLTFFNRGGVGWFGWASVERYGAQYSESVRTVSKATIDVNGYCEIIFLDASPSIAG